MNKSFCDLGLIVGVDSYVSCSIAMVILGPLFTATRLEGFPCILFLPSEVEKPPEHLNMTSFNYKGISCISCFYKDHQRGLMVLFVEDEPYSTPAYDFRETSVSWKCRSSLVNLTALCLFSHAHGNIAQDA